MKKIYSLMIMVLGVLTFSACESDRDDNPTFNEPETFILNVPTNAASTTYDLAHSESLDLTCERPDYGASLSSTYSVQVSLEETFKDADEADGTNANYTVLTTTFPTMEIKMDALELALAVADLWAATSTEPIPVTPIPLYFRLKSVLVASALGECYSNVIKLPNVLTYQPVVEIKLPKAMYLMGSMAGSKNEELAGWKNWQAMVPVSDQPGKFWSIQYFDAGDEMKFNTVDSWGGDTGYSSSLVPEESAALAMVTGEKDGANIKVGKAGWYIVVITAKVKGVDLKYTLEFFKPEVYITGGDITNGWGVAKPDFIFTVPTDATGSFEYLLTNNVRGGDLRIFTRIPNVDDWWRSEFVVADGKIEYRADRGELGKIGIQTTVSVGQKVTLNFLKGEGSVQ